ncbi:response regulator [Methylovorus sp. MP688]|uniref:response regulator n=1 Tax=Methylovorus sp. (strain MP688) TaxID=887061 RepID=UPI00059DBA0D|nr:response regulator [Methylovorus sp. MP688]
MIEEHFPFVNIMVAKSVVSSVQVIDENQFDLVILDLAIPDYDESNEASQDLGGVIVFRYLQQVHPNVPVIVITQYETLKVGSVLRDISNIKDELSEEFGAQFLGLLQYKLNDDYWKNCLINFLRGHVSEFKAYVY